LSDRKTLGGKRRGHHRQTRGYIGRDWENASGKFAIGKDKEKENVDKTVRGRQEKVGVR